jgi:cysteine desulfurase
VGALVVRSDLRLQPLIGGGGQERGLRGGTEPVVLAAGLARALALAEARLQAHAGVDPIAPLRDALLQALLACDGLRLTGPNPLDPQAPGRLPHHISLLVAGPGAQPLSGRRLVRALWQQGVAVSSGSACSSGRAAHPDGLSPSPVLEAMGYGPGEAASGLRLSLGPWHSRSDLIQVPAAVVQARRQLLAS